MEKIIINPQDMFNKCWQRFVVEKGQPAVQVLKKRCDNEDIQTHVCSYLTPDGRRCAIGLCIPDDHPALKFEANYSSLCCTFGEFQYSKLLGDLQRELHDTLQHNGVWQRDVEQAYREVAAKYNFSIPNEN